MWNYRVIKHSEIVDGKECISYQIAEVYYNEEVGIKSITKLSDTRGYSDSSPIGDTPEELKRELEYMMKAFNLPVLE